MPERDAMQPRGSPPTVAHSQIRARTDGNAFAPHGVSNTTVSFSVTSFVGYVGARGQTEVTERVDNGTRKIGGEQERDRQQSTLKTGIVGNGCHALIGKGENRLDCVLHVPKTVFVRSIPLITALFACLIGRGRGASSFRRRSSCCCKRHFSPALLPPKSLFL